MNSEYIKKLIKEVDGINRKKEIKLDKQWDIKKKSVNPKPRFKIIKKVGCSFCDKALKLLEENNIIFVQKKQLSDEEKNIILKERGEYKTYPKIFELNNDGQTYNFLGGFEELKNRINLKKY